MSSSKLWIGCRPPSLNLREPPWPPPSEGQVQEDAGDESERDDDARRLGLGGGDAHHGHRDARWHDKDKPQRSRAELDAEGAREMGTSAAQLYRRRELEDCRRRGEEVVDAQDHLEVETDQEGDDCHLQQDGIERCAEARVAAREYGGRQTLLRHPEQLEGVLEQLGGEEP